MNEENHSIKAVSPRDRHFRKIVVAIDFSPGSDWAIARAARLPLAPDATLTLLHVCAAASPAEERESAQRSLEEQRERALQLCAEAGALRVKVAPVLLEGRPFVDIIRYARGQATDLVVLGRHGKRAVKDLFIGSTAERVIRKGSTPVLLVNNKADHPYSKPLLALELEDTSQATLDLALRAVPEEVTTFFAIHAYHIPFEGMMRLHAAREFGSYSKEFRESVQERMDQFLASQVVPGVQWSASLRHDEPRTAILNEIFRLQSDLVVVGTHARSGLAHVLVGSVAEAVIRSATCDVLVARPARFSFELP